MNEMKTVLITGASSGIGEALADVFAREGYSLVLVARNREKLDALKIRYAKEYGVMARCIIQDLSAEGAAERICAQLAEYAVSIDILVNNAGLGSYGTFWEEDVKTEREVMMVNMVALTQLARYLLPGMIERAQGKILNIGSVASFVPGVGMATYFATKAYVLSFSEALAEEVRGLPITVTLACPGTTQTNFFKHESGVQSPSYQDPSVVARDAYRALMRGQRITFSQKKYFFLFFLTRFLPRNVVTRIAARMIAKD